LSERLNLKLIKSDYELFNHNNISIRHWSWNYRGCGVRKHYVHHDKRLVEPVEVGHHLKHKRGKGFFDSLKKAASSDVAKSISKSLRPMATDYLRSKLPQGGVMGALGNLALNEASNLAERHGYGVKHHKKRGRPKKGGALIAAGYGGH